MAASKGWFYQLMGETMGPFTSDQIARKLAAGEISDDTLVRQGDKGEWLPLWRADPTLATKASATAFASPLAPARATTATTASGLPVQPKANRHINDVVEARYLFAKTWIGLNIKYAVGVAILGALPFACSLVSYFLSFGSGATEQTLGPLLYTSGIMLSAFSLAGAIAFSSYMANSVLDIEESTRRTNQLLRQVAALLSEKRDR